MAPTNSVGEFSDINLARAPELLGHGNVNQVFKVTFNTASGPKTKVFKPLSESEVSDFIAAAATRMGIDEFRPNYGGRNVASSRLARLFGLPHVCETNFALIDGQLGILMDFEPGVSPTKEVSPVIGQEHQDHRYLSEYQRITNITDRRLTPDEMAYRTQLQIYLASHGFSEIAKIETQGNALKVTFTQAVAINYDPRVCLDLLEGHFLDFICAQGDRNPGNILIRQGERNGAVFIDNDISFGDRITCADDLRDNPPYYFGELPAIATQQIKDNIGQVTDEQIREQLQDLFAPELAERTITATIARVNYLRQALGLPTTAPLPAQPPAPATPAIGMVRPRSPAPQVPIVSVGPDALSERLAPPAVPPLEAPEPPQAQSRPTTPTSRPQTPSATPPPRPRTPISRPRTPVAPQIQNNYVTRYLYRLDQARTAGNLMPYPATVAGRT